MRFMTRSFAAATTGALLLAACTPVATDTGDPYTRTREGALSGAALGAVAGAALGGDSEDVLLGGVLGAVTGGVVGQQLDQQATQLRREFENDRIGVVNTGDELVVTMPQDILFEVDSAVVDPALQSDLRVLAGSLLDFPDSNVLIFGHTDSTGPAEYNRDLSERRAGSVARVMVRSGVSPSRISTVGLGESDPIASNATARGRAQNRRVEIVIRPTR